MNCEFKNNKDDYQSADPQDQEIRSRRSDINVSTSAEQSTAQTLIPQKLSKGDMYLEADLLNEKSNDSGSDTLFIKSKISQKTSFDDGNQPHR